MIERTGLSPEMGARIALALLAFAGVPSGCDTEPRAAQSNAVVPASAPRAGEPATRDFPEANLALAGVTLLGGTAIALISVDERAQEPYRVGEEIVPGIKLGAIYADHVVLRHENRYRILRLKGRPNSAPVATAEAPANPLLDPDLAADGGSEDFLREVQVTPHYEGGFMVQHVAAGSIFERLGVRPGDRVYSLDSLTIVRLEELSRSSGIAGADRVWLEVVRDGQRVALTYQF